METSFYRHEGLNHRLLVTNSAWGSQHSLEIAVEALIAILSLTKRIETNGTFSQISITENFIRWLNFLEPRLDIPSPSTLIQWMLHPTGSEVSTWFQGKRMFIQPISSHSLKSLFAYTGNSETATRQGQGEGLLQHRSENLRGLRVARLLLVSKPQCDNHRTTRWFSVLKRI